MVLGFGPAAPPIRLHLYLSGVVNIIQISTAGTKIYFCSTFSPLFFWRLQRGLQFPHFYCKLIMHTLRNLHSASVRGVCVCVCVGLMAMSIVSRLADGLQLDAHYVYVYLFSTNKCYD